MLKHAFVSGKADGGDATLVQPSDWNADHTIDSEGLVIPAGAAPSVPADGSVKLFAKNQAERIMPAFMGPSGLDSLMMPHLAKNGWASWKPTFTGTSISAIGSAALTATGTVTSAPYAATSLHTRGQRVDYLVTTASTTAVAGYRGAALNYRGAEGFHMIFRICPATGTTLTTDRCFVGMASSTSAPTDVEPSTLTNIVGVGYGAADTNWQFYFNSSSGAATAIDTGIAAPTTDRQGIYTIQVFSPPGSAWFAAAITDEATGTYVSSGQVSTNIPSTTVGLAPRGYHSVGGTSSVVGMTLFSGWVDMDN